MTAGDGTGVDAERANSHLAARLGILGNRLSNLGRREEALAASNEAVTIYRRLAETHPDAFLPDLARSVSVVSNIFALLGRSVEAARAAHHALEILAPFVERNPDVFEGLARTIVRNVLSYSEAASKAPDIALLKRIARVIGDSAPS